MKKNEDKDLACNCQIIHENQVNKCAAELLPEEQVYDLADFFKVLGDSTRIRILQALSCGELCVCDLSFVLKMSQSAISHQLKTLKQARLVRNRRDGKVIYYSLADRHVELILNQGLEHILEGNK